MFMWSLAGPERTSRKIAASHGFGAWSSENDMVICGHRLIPALVTGSISASTCVNEREQSPEHHRVEAQNGDTD